MTMLVTVDDTVVEVVTVVESVSEVVVVTVLIL